MYYVLSYQIISCYIALHCIISYHIKFCYIYIYVYHYITMHIHICMDLFSLLCCIVWYYILWLSCIYSILYLNIDIDMVIVYNVICNIHFIIDFNMYTTMQYRIHIYYIILHHYSTFYYIAVYCITMHHTTLHYIILHFIIMYCFSYHVYITLYNDIIFDHIILCIIAYYYLTMF